MSKIAGAMAALGVVAGLGVAALPMASYAAESAPVTIRATVDSSIAVSTDGVDLVDFGNIDKGSGENIQTIAVTVTGTVTNYNLGVMDYDDNTNMVNVTTPTSTSVIPTLGDGATTLTGGWGFRSEDRHVSNNAWKGMPKYGGTDADKNIVDVGKLDTTSGSVTNVQFGINLNGLTQTLDNGTYEDKVIFTATDADTTVTP